jgi:CheY-like chemotaxis protein
MAEHDGHIASILKRMLDDAGYQVEHVTEGPRAIDACHREPRPNIVILRQVLTGMNGNVVASRLHELPSTAAIPVVLYAGSGLGSHKPTGVNILIEDEDPRKILAAARTLL